MGIPGLTSFIQNRSDRFLKPFRLQNTYLVIDGNSLCAQLYTQARNIHTCFGGDYDVFAAELIKFFEALKQCNITPIVLLDGNYEDRKYKTIFMRVKNRVELCRQISSATEGQSQYQIFPLFARIVFVDVVRNLGLFIYRCEYEADCEIACLAKNLNCPVLSYDSDFFVFDVFYIPYNTLDLYIQQAEGTNNNYLHCKLYKTQYFLDSFKGFTKQHLPLLATLLGNDYIKSSTFKAFYNELKLVQGRGNLNQRKIQTVIQWLQNEPYEVAINKVLSRLKTGKRTLVAKEIKANTQVYVTRDSVALKHLKLNLSKETAQTSFTFNQELLNTNIGESDNDDSDSPAETDTKAVMKELNRDKKATENTFPQWFMDKHMTCQYPQIFYEIARCNIHFLIPQVENYDNINSHSICYKILAAINKILKSSGNNTQQLTVVTRNDNNNGVSRFAISHCDVAMPTLRDIPTLTASDRLTVVLDMLGLEDNVKTSVREVFQKLPADWSLFMLGIVYWIKNASPCVNNCQVYGVLLGAIALKVVDKKIGVFRSAQKLERSFSQQLKEQQTIAINDAEIATKTNNDATIATTTDTDVTKPDITKLDDILSQIQTLECVTFMKKVVHNFSMDLKLSSNAKWYDVRIVDSLAQFQASEFYTRTANELLDSPLDNVTIADFYNGTFVYNVCAYFKKRTDLLAFIKREVFGKQPTLWTTFSYLVDLIEGICKVDHGPGKTKRRKKDKRSNEEKHFRT